MNPARILIVEDNPTNLKLMRYLLSRYGYNVVTAGDGEEGVRAAHEHRPDVILMDIQMPKLNGYQATAQIRNSISGIPIVAITAYAMVDDRDRILSRGFDGYIAKPIAPEYFVGQVEMFVPEPLLVRKRAH